MGCGSLIKFAVFPLGCDAAVAWLRCVYERGLTVETVVSMTAMTVVSFKVFCSLREEY